MPDAGADHPPDDQRQKQIIDDLGVVITAFGFAGRKERPCRDPQCQ